MKINEKERNKFQKGQNYAKLHNQKEIFFWKEFTIKKSLQNIPMTYP